jgi:AraC family transcriptional regulator
MFLKITAIPEKILVGKHLPMSLAENKTADLWKGFMPHKKSIDHALGEKLYSVQVHPEGIPFTYNSIFIKWAAVEVTEVSEIP